MARCIARVAGRPSQRSGATLDVLSRQTRNGSRVLMSGDLVPARWTISVLKATGMRRLLDDLGCWLARSDAGDGAWPFPVTQTSGVRPRCYRERRPIAECRTPLTQGQIIEVEAPRPVLLNGDPDRLRQLIMILLDNAIRHTPPGDTCG